MNYKDEFDENEIPSWHEVRRDMIDVEIDQSIALAVIRQEVEVQGQFGNVFLEQYLKGLAKEIEYRIEEKHLKQ